MIYQIQTSFCVCMPLSMLMCISLLYICLWVYFFFFEYISFDLNVSTFWILVDSLSYLCETQTTMENYTWLCQIWMQWKFRNWKHHHHHHTELLFSSKLTSNKSTIVRKYVRIRCSCSQITHKQITTSISASLLELNDWNFEERKVNVYWFHARKYKSTNMNLLWLLW